MRFHIKLANQFVRLVVLVAAVALAPVRPLAAQLIPRPTPPLASPLPRQLPPSLNLTSDDDRSGPRIGAAYIIGGSVTAENQGKHLAPLTTLFGWQIEHQFPTGRKDAPLPMTELVLLVGGLEQNLFLPSASWLVGMRQPNGWEVGVGPALTGAGVQVAAAAGITRTIGNVNVPMNLAVAPGRRGASISFTTGFNVKRGL
jgi:hypothetical protein